MDELSSLAPIKLELPSKPVQELIKNLADQESIPKRYICSTENKPNYDSKIPYMDSNIIDLELLSSPSSSPQGLSELQKLRSVLKSWGCFQLINHGVASLMDQIREVTKQYFELPLEVKQKYLETCGEARPYQGYGGDPKPESIPLNWNDRLYLVLHPTHLRNLEFWPHDVPTFRETLDEYAIEIKKLQEKILKIVAKLLNLEETIFLTQYGEMAMNTRFSYYPPCPSPDQVIGIGEHSDVGFLTIILQDKEVEGLQVLKNDKWFKVPTISNALFVNIGDQLEILSNGAVKSPQHKVVTNSDRAKISVAMFCSPVNAEEIGPLSELIDDERPPLYKHVKNYRRLYFENNARGQVLINKVKI